MFGNHDTENARSGYWRDHGVGNQESYTAHCHSDMFTTRPSMNKVSISHRHTELQLTQLIPLILYRLVTHQRPDTRLTSQHPPPSISATPVLPDLFSPRDPLLARISTHSCSLSPIPTHIRLHQSQKPSAASTTTPSTDYAMRPQALPSSATRQSTISGTGRRLPASRVCCWGAGRV